MAPSVSNSIPSTDRDDVISNPVTGERLRFLQRREDTDGELLQMELWATPKLMGPIEHLHPNQEETFRIQSGELVIKIDGRTRRLGPGDEATVPRETAHTHWVESDEPVCAIVEFRPALRTEEGFETLFSLGRDGRLNKKGLPSILQLAAMHGEYSNHMYLSSLPVVVQKAGCALLAPLARLMGYRATYPDHEFPDAADSEPDR
jgi:mannose-6-phosphate isomerase-like protein (cupin superfamily)